MAHWGVQNVHTKVAVCLNESDLLCPKFSSSNVNPRTCSDFKSLFIQNFIKTKDFIYLN